MIVVDANIIVYLLINGEYTANVKLLLQKDNNWIAPILWKSEFRNVLSNYLRNNYFDIFQALFLMQEAEDLMKNREFEINSKHVLELAELSGCSAYDCEYIALAQDTKTKLITTDKKLSKSFPDIAINVQNFLNH